MCQNGVQNGGQNRGKSEKNRVRDGSAKKDAKKCENGCLQIVPEVAGTQGITSSSTFQGCLEKLQKGHQNDYQNPCKMRSGRVVKKQHEKRCEKNTKNVPKWTPGGPPKESLFRRKSTKNRPWAPTWPKMVPRGSQDAQNLDLGRFLTDL